jgi:hypothetical protein
MALANYPDLLASVAAWLNRTDLTAVIPDFVTLAEERIARDLRIRKQVVNTTLSTVASTQSVTLPSDFLEIENISITSTSPYVALSVVTPEIMDRKYPATYWTGQPAVYCLLGDTIQFGPTPDSVYTISLDYYQRLNIATSTTNWLLTNYPSIYLNACLVEGAAYLMDADKAQAYDARYRAAVDMLQTTDDGSLRSGSAMRVRVL